ncbi:hypothetical protein D1872_335270 [compost metagenome]
MVVHGALHWILQRPYPVKQLAARKRLFLVFVEKAEQRKLLGQQANGFGTARYGI